MAVRAKIAVENRHKPPPPEFDKRFQTISPADPPLHHQPPKPQTPTPVQSVDSLSDPKPSVPP